MALLERLQILVDGNASGAIREFQKVGAVADRELGRTEDKLAKLSNRLTSFGTGLLAGGAVAVGGLKQLADSASAYGEQVSAATVTFGEEGAKKLEEFAEAAADTANISKTEATKAANGFAAFARQAGLTGTAAADFSTNLVQLAGDISSFRDISVEDALAALQSGLAGEGEPIRRLGGDISDVALKAEYLALTGEEVTGSLTNQQKVLAINSKLFKDFELAQGDVLRTQDSLANQTRNAQANFENLKTELGVGLVPIFAKVVGGVSDVLGSLGNLSDADATLGGKIAGIGTAATIAVGGLSVLGGQVINLRDKFTTLDKDGVRSLNNVGRATAALSIGTAVIGGVLALNAALDQADQSASDLQQTTDRLQQGLSREENFRTFIEQTRQADGGFEDFKENLDALFAGGGPDYTLIDNLAVDLGDVRERFEALLGQPAALRAAIDSLKGRTFIDPISGGVDQEAIDLLNEYEGKLNDSQKAQEFQAQASQLQADATNAVTEATEEEIDTFEKVQGYLDDYADKIAILTVNYDALGERASAFTDAIERSTTLDDEISAARSLGDAFTGLRENIGALPAELDLATLAFGGYNEEQRKAIDALLAAGDQSSKFLETLIEQGRTTDEIRFGAALLREEYRKQFEQLGFNEEQIQNYLTVLGLTPDQVNTAITLSGEEEARFKIEAYQALIEGTPPEKLTEFYAELAEGDYIAAAEKLDELARDRTATITIQQRIAAAQTVEGAAQTNISAYEFLAWAALGGNKEAAAALNALGAVGAAGGTGAGFPQRARGGSVAANMSYVVGEEGPEMFVPRTSGTIVPNNQLQGGTVNLTQNITTGDPILTAAEVVRRQRDAEFLAGV
jgi:hypothetical protein